MGFKIFSIVVAILFSWVIYPYKWIRILVFKLRKIKAIGRCNDMALETRKRCFVVQNGMKFYVGTRSDFRKWNARNNKRMKRMFDFDCRNSIVYHFDVNGKAMYYERVAAKKRMG